ncbi:unnamed protein product [Effrenium voratum]|nr:unnamed protein product [Effrenium voratum]
MLSPNANSAEQDLPSHLARAQQAFDRVSEQLSSLRASRVKASPSKASSGETEAAEGVRQFKEAKEELKQGLEALRASRSAHLALRRQVAQELQGLDLSWDRGVVSSILAASGLGPKRFDSEPQADAEAAASKLSEVPETDSPLPSPPCTPSRDATSSPSQAKATSPNRAILHTPVRRSSAAAKAVRWTRPVSPKEIHLRGWTANGWLGLPTDVCLGSAQRTTFVTCRSGRLLGSAALPWTAWGIRPTHRQGSRPSGRARGKTCEVKLAAPTEAHP